jgi:hypothetical protein
MKSMTEVYNEWVGRVVLVTNVDEYGFLGRDRHPVKSDIGQIGAVIDVLEVGDEADILNNTWYCVLLVQLPNDRMVEFIDFELDILENICAA